MKDIVNNFQKNCRLLKAAFLLFIFLQNFLQDQLNKMS